MLKFAVATQVRATELASALADRRARRGLTLVEYVLGASFVAAILLILRRPLIEIAEQQLAAIRRALR
jgi:hypothetical protein